MTVAYNKHYQTKNLFGEPYPELIDFFGQFAKNNKILDLGCGQGRDAIALARLGFVVTGIDSSKVGIEQMDRTAKTEHLKLCGIIADIFEFEDFGAYDFVLLDSMFHFEKKDLIKETEFIKRILQNIRKGCLLIFCIQDTGNKVEVLKETILFEKKLDYIEDKKLTYVFVENTHTSISDYRMIVIRKR
jgi:2-polyprenyl-3-methyl-5-hydroxy-6-metoxy-1,4-benzoquinol methylase